MLVWNPGMQESEGRMSGRQDLRTLKEVRTRGSTMRQGENEKRKEGDKETRRRERRMDAGRTAWSVF